MAKRQRRAGRRASEPVSVAMAWYDAPQWAKLKQVAEDRDALDDSYEDWQHQAQQLERDLRSNGIEVKRVHVDVEALVTWCASNHRPINGEARSEYAAQLAANTESS